MTTDATIIGRDDFSIRVLSTGEVQLIQAHGLSINQYLPSAHEKGFSGVYLRSYGTNGEVVNVQRICGAGFEYRMDCDSVTWVGSSLGAHHQVTLRLGDNQSILIWSTEVTLTENCAAATFDVVFAQDIALASEGLALASEPYVSQYLTHEIYPDSRVILTRQAMSEYPKLPLLVTGTLQESAGMVTDAIQLFGIGAKAGVLDGQLARSEWQSQIRQYEMANPAIVSARFSLTSEAPSWDGVFFQQVIENYQGRLDGKEADLIAATAQSSATHVSRAHLDESVPTVTPNAPTLNFDHLLNGEIMSDAELVSLGTSKPMLAERAGDGSLLSYFDSRNQHIVSGAKELQTERSHGHILKTQSSGFPNKRVLSATSYAPGVFLSHITAGNTNMNRIVTVQRHGLNLLKATGVRLLVSDNRNSFVLGVPSALIVGLQRATWVYQTDLGKIIVNAYATDEALRLEAKCNEPLHMEFTISLEDSPGSLQWRIDSRTQNRIDFRSAEGTSTYSHCADLVYSFQTNGAFTLDSDLDMYKDTSMLIAGNDFGLSLDLEVSAGMGAKKEDDAHEDYRFAFRSLPEATGLASLRPLVEWYTHDAEIHFQTPHGLEQYSGAAWGVRDVLQGPFELYLTQGRTDICRKILLKVFSRQSLEGSFPQWFMFDEYEDIYQEQSHGDIPVWVLFATGEYLAASGASSILEVNVPYWDPKQNRATSNATVREHLNLILTYLAANTSPNTTLPSYGEGDWDDTLQPVRPEMRRILVSTWTSALLIQALELLEGELNTGSEQELRNTVTETLESLRQDFRKYLIPDGQLCGYFLDADEPQYLLHPRDQISGLSARLIPMTRAIIGEILEPKEASDHLELIREHLLYPHGVHLMDGFAPYNQGKTNLFLRAEQAAMVGREVGLMYTHAHIRYVEALTKMGNTFALEEMLRISPFDCDHDPGMHLLRQRNTFYSSSDAAFDTRTQGQSGLEKLKQGKVPSRGGWRIYSSGPGIYLRQLIENVFGIRQRKMGLVVDPVLPASADGTELEIRIQGVLVLIRYRKTGDDIRVLGGTSFETSHPLSGRKEQNRYREAGILIKYEELDSCTHMIVEY